MQSVSHKKCLHPSLQRFLHEMPHSSSYPSQTPCVCVHVSSLTSCSSNDCLYYKFLSVMMHKNCGVLSHLALVATSWLLMFECPCTLYSRIHFVLERRDTCFSASSFSVAKRLLATQLNFWSMHKITLFLIHLSLLNVCVKSAKLVQLKQSLDVEQSLKSSATLYFVSNEILPQSTLRWNGTNKSSSSLYVWYHRLN